jgi:hypothetical protein
MRKALLIVAMLLLVTPVMATTTITAVQESQFTAPDGNKVQTVRIDYSSDVNIRAFALDINIDSNNNSPNFQGIRNFKTGESNAASPGYGIFPSRFRDFIQVLNSTDVNTADGGWADPNYNPTTSWNEPGTTSHTWGMGYPQMIVEMGTLYVGDANKPPLSGTLFRFDVNSWGVVGTFNLTIAADTLRGGVVNSDGNTITATCVGTAITFTAPGATVPNVVGMTQTAANNAITGATLNVKTTTGKYSDVCAVTIVMSQVPTAGTIVPLNSDVNYVYSLGKFPTPAQIIYPKWDSDCNVPIYWSPVAGATGYQLERSANSGGSFASTIYTGAATFYADLKLAAGPNYRYRVFAKNADSTSAYMTGTFDCNAYLSTCGNTADPNWANWVSAGRPDCWCKAVTTAADPNGSGYQCDGDADGATSGSPYNYRVYNGDLNYLTGNWKKKAADLTNDPNVILAGKLKINSACANFSHKSSGSPYNYRVYNADLNILTANWKKLNSSSVTATNKLPGNCPR